MLQKLVPYRLVYLSTPYTLYPHGLERAFIDACILAARLIEKNIKCYSPIAHIHPIAHYGDLDALNHTMWIEYDYAMLSKSDAVVVGRMEGWDKSAGVAEEVEIAKALQKPIFHIEPDTLKLTESERVPIN